MTPILLDTHAFIWASDNQLQYFSQTTQQQLERALQQNTLYLSAISLWEVAMLVTKKRIDVSMSAERWLTQAIEKTGIRILAIDIITATLSTELELHGDPADRLIAAGAIHHKMLLCSQDEKILQFAIDPTHRLQILTLS